MNFQINFDDVGGSFESIADQLLNHHILVVNNQKYRLTDIEFYLFCEERHKDIYCHKHDLQKASGTWYFHGSGVDITFGCEKYYGGILIREMKPLNSEVSKDYIAGPRNVVREIFKGLNKVNQLNNTFGLKPHEFENPSEMFAVPRIGLNRVKDENDFHDKPYRFLIDLKLPHKEKEKLVKFLNDQGHDKEILNKKIGYSYLK